MNIFKKKKAVKLLSSHLQEVITLNPDHILIFTLGEDCDMADAQNIADSFKASFPEVKALFTLDKWIGSVYPLDQKEGDNIEGAKTF